MKRHNLLAALKKVVAEQKQDFIFGAMVFDVDKGLKAKAKEDTIDVDPGWSRFIRVDKDHVDQTDLENPVLVATVFLEEKYYSILIDGHHRMAKAVKEKVKELPAMVLDFAQTMKIMSAPNKRKMMAAERKLRGKGK